MLSHQYIHNILLVILPIFANVNAIASCDPLFLTPYIESHKIDEAKKLSSVRDLPNAPKLISYAGFLTVNKQYESNMFFWFFPALKNPESSPILLWLQGGPGASSLFGLFYENGPYVVDKNLNVTFNDYSWAQEFSMLYIDNPVGTGFSFTQKKDGFAINEQNVADDLYEALQQFFTLFSEYRNNHFYVTGESYAGKYVPAIGYKLHTMSEISNINFKGIAIGNGWIDPLNMLDIGSFLYQTGLIDEIELNHFYLIQNKTAEDIAKGDFRNAFVINDELIGGDLINTTSYFQNVTGLNFYLNILMTNSPPELDYYINYLNLSLTRQAIHVGCLPFNDGNNTVEEYLIDDQFRSVKPWFTTLINNYKVLIYSGQLDIIVAVTLTENFLKNLEWKYSKQFASVKRSIWKVSNNDKEIAGYAKQVANFTQIVLRNAGHLVPFDQPRAAFDMINRFIKSQPFDQPINQTILFKEKVHN